MPTLVEEDAFAGGLQEGVVVGQREHSIVGEGYHLGRQQHADLAPQAAYVAQEHEGAIGPVGLQLSAPEALAQHTQPPGVLVLLVHEQLDRACVGLIAGLGRQALQVGPVTGLSQLEAGDRGSHGLTADPDSEGGIERRVELTPAPVAEVFQPASVKGVTHILEVNHGRPSRAAPTDPHHRAARAGGRLSRA